jgi:UMF1 family MFS transporter
MRTDIYGLPKNIETKGYIMGYYDEQLGAPWSVMEIEPLHSNVKANMNNSITTANTLEQKTYHKRVLAWEWYDWASHSYLCAIASAFFPPYFVAIASIAFLAPGALNSGQAAAIARDTASNYFALTISLALFVVAILAPILGAFADITGRRKRILMVITITASLICSLMFSVTTGLWVWGLVLYFLSQIAFNLALGFNSSLLPHVARQEDLSRVSSMGYTLGYIGGGILLLCDSLLYLFAPRLGITQAMAIRIAFVTVGLWWLGFSIPLFLHVPEPAATPLAHGGRGNAVLDTYTRLANTFKAALRYRELFKMLIAFWFYMEGIGAISLLSTSYGAALGLNTAVLLGTLLMIQFVAFPYAMMYGRIPDKTNKRRSFYVSQMIWTGVSFPLMGVYANLNGNISIPLAFAMILGSQLLGIGFSYLVGRHLFSRLSMKLTTKRAVIMGLIIYIVVPIWGFFLKSQAEFFMLGWLVGTVQGGAQALSRSIYASLTPKGKSGEFFGLYGLFEKFAGILGPLLYGIVGTITHNPRDSILSVALFFLIGIFLLWRVNEKKGAELAAEEEFQIASNQAAD